MSDTGARAREQWRFPRWGQRGTAGASIPAELTFEAVSQVYGATRALDGVSLTVAPGEIVCLLGHSGCGKTTLLRVAAGVENPSEGRVLLDGIEVSGPKTLLPPEQRGTGLMFQEYALFPHLTVLENVTFGLRDLPPRARESSSGTSRSPISTGVCATPFARRPSPSCARWARPPSS